MWCVRVKKIIWPSLLSCNVLQYSEWPPGVCRVTEMHVCKSQDALNFSCSSDSVVAAFKKQQGGRDIIQAVIQRPGGTSENILTNPENASIFLQAQVSDIGGRILPLTWPVWSSSWLLSSCFSCVVINVYSTWQPVVSDHNCFRSVVNAANCYAITWHPTGALFTRETQNFPQRSLRHKVRKRAKIAPSVPSCWGTTSAVRCGRNSADGQTT